MLAMVPAKDNPGEMKFIKWRTLMNVHEHPPMVQWFITCSSKTVYDDKSWILINTWWTHIVHDLGNEVHIESLMNSDAFLWTSQDQFSS